jgi:hypothetical protein
LAKAWAWTEGPSEAIHRSRMAVCPSVQEKPGEAWSQARLEAAGLNEGAQRTPQEWGDGDRQTAVTGPGRRT